MRRSIIPLLFIVYAGLLLFVSWWPFKFHFNPQAMALVEWPPFKFLAPEYWQGGKADILKIMTFVPLGILLAVTTAIPIRVRTVIGRASLAGASLSLLVQTGWFFLPGRSVSATALALNVIGTLAGASPICFHYLSRRTLGLLTASYCTCFLVAATWPWQFSLQAATSPGLYRRIEWMPYHRKIAMWVLKEDTLNSLMTVPLGLLAASYLLRERPTRRAVIYATLLGVGCSVLVETLQCFLPTRTPSFSDLSLNTLGAFAGAAVAYYLEHWHEPEQSAAVHNGREISCG